MAPTPGMSNPFNLAPIQVHDSPAPAPAASSSSSAPAAPPPPAAAAAPASQLHQQAGNGLGKRSFSATGFPANAAAESLKSEEGYEDKSFLVDGAGWEDDDATAAGEQDGKKRRKRNRTALSCIECKRRKIKCDRKIPCEACVKRGEQAKCAWEGPKERVEPQPFALAVDHDALKRRVMRLESLIINNQYQLPAPPATHPSGGMLPQPAPLANLSGSAPTGSIQPSPGGSVFDSGAQSSHGGGVHHGATPGNNISDPGTASSSAYHHQISSSFLPPAGVATAEGRSAGAAGTKGAEEEDAEDGRDSDTEDAALVLEELALGRKLTRLAARKDSNYSAVVPARQVFGERPPDSSATPFSRILTSLIADTPTGYRRNVLEQMWAVVPPIKAVSWLVNAYFERIAWGWHQHHRPTFMAEFESYCTLVKEKRQMEIDPLYMAVLMMTIALAADTLEEPVSNANITLTKEDLDKKPSEWYEASRTLLEVGDWTSRPRMRTLQTIALFAPYLMFRGTPLAYERLQTYVAAGITMAQHLGLHRLGDDPKHMPDFVDPILPDEPCTLRRELALRLFYNLLFIDYLSFRIRSSLPPEALKSPLPGNFNDEDLNEYDFVVPHPPEVMTDWSCENLRFRIARQQKNFNDILMSGVSFDYSTVLEVDRGFREILLSLPGSFTTTVVSSDERKTSIWRRCTHMQAIWNRLVRLHRPFLSRAYREATFAYSRTAALEAARQVLTYQTHLNDVPLIKAGFPLLHIQGAAVVLLMDIWTIFEPESAQADADCALIESAKVFLSRGLKSRHNGIQKVAQQSLTVIELLFGALEDRKRQWRVNRGPLGNNGGDIAEPEPYGRLLKRVGLIVKEAAEKRSLPNAAAAQPSPALKGALDLGLPLSDGATWPPLPQSAANNLGFPALDGSGATLDFNLEALAGPEYANESFDWNRWSAIDQFQSLVSFD